jgi:hypothetical protein
MLSRSVVEINRFGLCENKIFSGLDLDLTSDKTYALLCGLQHLVTCNIKESFFWLVDVVIIHLLLIGFNDESEMVGHTLYLWNEILRVDADIGDELRARMSWNIVEIEFIMKKEFRSPSNLRDRKILPYFYLQSIVTHSPKGYFSDSEKKIAESILSKMWFVDINSNHEVEDMPLAVRRLPSTPEIRAVGVSFDKTLAAVAQKSGRIILVCVPSLVELWQYTTEYRSISFCTFAPDDSFVLFGKLETVL